MFGLGVRPPWREHGPWAPRRAQTSAPPVVLEVGIVVVVVTAVVASVAVVSPPPGSNICGGGPLPPPPRSDVSGGGPVALQMRLSWVCLRGSSWPGRVSGRTSAPRSLHSVSPTPSPSSQECHDLSVLPTAFSVSSRLRGACAATAGPPRREAPPPACRR